MNKKTKKIREVFQIILNEKLMNIIKAKEEGSSDMHNYTIPYLSVISAVKKEKYLSQNTLNKYDKEYRKIIGY